VLSHTDNLRVCQVSADTPMGKVMRHYWHPIARSASLEVDGVPLRVRLLGENFVAFRASNGQIGFFDELCPHRCASLALARNEGNGLRCLYHGWKFDVSGKCVDVPTEPEDRRVAFAAKVPLRHYLVKEAAGVVWVNINRDGPAAPFPNYEFMGLPIENVDARIGRIACNWLQALESVLDSAHLSFLHSGVLVSRPEAKTAMSEGMRANFSATTEVTAPEFHMDERPYGFREAAIRKFADGRRLAKIREFVAPNMSFLPGFPGKATRRLLVIAVPVDDENCAQWVFNYRTDGPFPAGEIDDFWHLSNPDPNNFLTPIGTSENLWGQDRKAMKEGHFSGFLNRHFFEEDMIVQESMGKIVDRSREYLSQSDKTIIFVRRKLLASTHAVEKGLLPWGLDEGDKIDYSKIRSCAVYLGKDEDWKSVNSFSLTPEHTAAV